jgi:hypothetical protein
MPLPLFIDPRQEARQNGKLVRKPSCAQSDFFAAPRCELSIAAPPNFVKVSEPFTQVYGHDQGKFCTIKASCGDKWPWKQTERAACTSSKRTCDKLPFTVEQNDAIHREAAVLMQ